jgi:hypothetical protein
MKRAVAALAVLALCAPAAARGDELGLERVTTGPSGGNADVFTEMLVSSADGMRALFVSDEALTPDDHRVGFDYYERVGQTTRLLGQDIGDQDPRIGMGFFGASADATRIVFSGGGHWTEEDTDDIFTADVYTAKDGLVEWVSRGTQGGNENSFSAEPTAMSGDGNRIVFETSENLTADDTDYKTRDVYLREGGVTTRLSTGPAGGNGDGYDAEVVGQSDDARRIVIRTPERLTASDTDSRFDLYVRGGGQTVKVSPGNGPYDAVFSAVSSDGGAFVFTTQERLTADDTDTRADAYRAVGGAVARVSTGPVGGNSPDHPVGWEPNAFGGDVQFASDDGSRVVFGTFERLTADDTDHQTDAYLWTPAGVQKVTAGNGEQGGGWELGASVVGGSPDASHLVFLTRERLGGGDTDTHHDLYEWAAGTIRRVTTGPSGGNAPTEVYCPEIIYDEYCGSVRYVSEDGARIFFETDEKLVAADTDDEVDVYQRAGGVTTLLSPARPGRQPVWGETDKDVFFVDASLDGSIAYLQSEEQLTADDTNLRPDGVRVHPPAPGVIVAGLGGRDPGGAAPPAGGEPAVAAPAAGPAGGAAETPSAARVRLASRPSSLRLARGKTRLAARGRGLALRLVRTRRLIVGAERIVRGRRDGATCRKPTRALRHARPCRRPVTAARPLRLKATRARAVLRLGRRSLRPGRHRITITPLDAEGRAGAPVRITLRLKR